MEKTSTLKRTLKWLVSARPSPPARVTQTPTELRAVMALRRMPPEAGAGIATGMLGSPLYQGWLHGEPFAFFVRLLASWVCIAFFVGGLFALFAYWWNHRNHEELVVDPDSVSLRSGWGRKGTVRTFDRSAVRNLRLVRPYGESVRQAVRQRKRINWNEVNISGVGSRALCFDYQGKTVQFGAGLNEAGARELLALVSPRLAESPVPVT